MKNLYQHYVANGNRAGFWVQHEIWEGTASEIRVKSVDGKTEGSLSGEPPNYGEGPVLIDAYVNGSLSEENFQLPIASDQGFRLVDAPHWWNV
jgi:hypothetical protein